MILFCPLPESTRGGFGTFMQTDPIYAVKGNWQLDQTIQSKIIAMAFAMAAEIERDLISQRTTEALRARKAAGKPLGRPKGPGKSKLDPFQPEIEALLDRLTHRARHHETRHRQTL